MNARTVKWVNRTGDVNGYIPLLDEEGRCLVTSVEIHNNVIKNGKGWTVVGSEVRVG